MKYYVIKVLLYLQWMFRCGTSFRRREVDTAYLKLGHRGRNRPAPAALAEQIGNIDIFFRVPFWGSVNPSPSGEGMQ